MNKTIDIAEFERRVCERAYALWESEGRPHGRDEEHWRLSVEAVRAELAVAPAEVAVVPELKAEIAPAPETPAVVAPKAEVARAPAKPAAVKPKVAASGKKKAVAAKPVASVHNISTTLQ